LVLYGRYVRYFTYGTVPYGVRYRVGLTYYCTGYSSRRDTRQRWITLRT